MSLQPSPQTPARIFLVDDHPIVREGVALYLANYPEFKVCGLAGSAREALAVVQTLAVDCVILDLTLADENGLGLLTDLRRILPAVPVLILSMHGDPDLVRRALTLGASGFVRKEDAAGHLVTALRRVLQGEVYLPGDLSRQVLQEPAVVAGGTVTPGQLERLTAREREILTLLGQGKKIADIARLLNISPRTVDAHQANLKRKLVVESSRDLLLLAVRLTGSRQDP